MFAAQNCDRLRHFPSTRSSRSDSSPARKSDTWRTPSRHQVQLPKPVCPAFSSEEEDLSLHALEVPMTPMTPAQSDAHKVNFNLTEKEVQSRPDGVRVDDWFEFELKARLGRIDASMGTLRSLDTKLDQVLCLLRNGDFCGTGYDLDLMQRPSFKAVDDGRPSFRKKCALFGSASPKLPRIPRPPVSPRNSMEVGPPQGLRTSDIATSANGDLSMLLNAYRTQREESEASKAAPPPQGPAGGQAANGLASPRVPEAAAGQAAHAAQADAAQNDGSQQDDEPMSPKSTVSKFLETYSIGEQAKANIHESFERRMSNRHMIGMANFFEDSESGWFALIYARSMLPVIMLTVCVSLLQGLDDPVIDGIPAAVINTAIESIFLVEVFVRLVVSRSKRLFFLDVYNLIDIMSAAPLGLRIAMGFQVYTSTGACSPLCALLLGLVPVLRLLKLLRRFQNFHLLLRAFSLALEALPVLLFIWGVVCLVSAAALFIIEPRDNIPSLTIAVWVAAVSMTTLGYGDVYPVTNAGRLVIVILVVTSILYTAIPLGIIGSAFSEVWSDRDRILLTQRTRKRLMRAGYGARDIPYLFQIFDADGDGALDIDEFRTMVGFMKVGLTGQRVVELFDLFDADGGGSIDDREFVRALYPESYHDIYGVTAEPRRDSCEEIACACGTTMMPDALFCRKCGRKRPDAVASITESEGKLPVTPPSTQDEE